MSLLRFIRHLSSFIFTCYIATSFSTNLHAAPQYRPIMVSMSGFDTCPNGNPSESGTAAHVRQLTSDIAQMTGTPRTEMLWAASCNQKMNRLNAQQRIQTSQQVGGASFADKISYLAALTARPPFIVIIGHSWGGAQAIETAVGIHRNFSSWAQHPGFEYLSEAKIVLFTIDPIDSHFCHQPLLSALGNPDCFQAPRSLYLSGNSSLHESIPAVSSWTNIYQTDGRFLHSGPIPQLEYSGTSFRNIRRSYSTQDKPHYAIANDPWVWSYVRQHALELLN